MAAVGELAGRVVVGGGRGRRRVRTAEEIRSRKRAWQRERVQRSVYLGASMEGWRELRERAGLGGDPELAELLLDSFAARNRIVCSGEECPTDGLGDLRTTWNALSNLVAWLHDHSRQCPLTPSVKSVVMGRSTSGALVAIWACSTGHSYSWDMTGGSEDTLGNRGDSTSSAVHSQESDQQRKTEVMAAPSDHKTEEELASPVVDNTDCAVGDTEVSILDTAVEVQTHVVNKDAEESSEPASTDTMKESTEMPLEEPRLESLPRPREECTILDACQSAAGPQEGTEPSPGCAVSQDSGSEGTSSPSSTQAASVARQRQNSGKEAGTEAEMPDLLQLDCESDPDTQPDVAPAEDEEGNVACVAG